MFKQNKKLFYTLGFLLILITGLQYLLPQPPDLKRTYLAKNKSPFGCYAIYNLLPDVYSQHITTNSETFYNLNVKQNTGSTLLIINDRIDFNKNDLAAMYDFLKRGNTLFLAANEFNGPLNDSLHLKTNSSFYNFSVPLDSLLKERSFDLQFFSPELRHKLFTYPQLARTSHFENFDTARFKVISAFNRNKACLIKTRVASGTLYLMSVPDVFTNYFVANPKNKEVAYACLSLVKNETLIWDEYYKTFNTGSRSPLKFILESDSLYAAYLLVIFIILSYMILEGRRKQRAIPVKEPLLNSTLEFVNVISQVYYNSKNHKNIAVERIKYFYETLRKKFNVSTNDPGQQLYDELHELSGIERGKVRQLILYCERIKTSEELSEYELLELNRQIENFNKNSLR